MRRALVLGLAPLLLHPARADAGACAIPPPRAELVTGADATLAPDGALVAVFDDPAHAPAWTLRGGVKPTPTALAPGLIALALPASAGWITLYGADGKPLVRVQRAAQAVKPLAAPEVAAVEYRASQGRRGTSVAVVVSLKAAPPAGAVALVALGDQGARSWQRSDADPASKEIVIYRSGSCVTSPSGTIATNAGDKLQLAWVDASGRLSAKSAAITVTAKPEPTRPGPGGP